MGKIHKKDLASIIQQCRSLFPEPEKLSLECQDDAPDSFIIEREEGRITSITSQPELRHETHTGISGKAGTLDLQFTIANVRISFFISGCVLLLLK